MTASDEMVKGYLEAAEFADKPEGCDRCEFNKASIRRAARDCSAFLASLSEGARELADTRDGGRDFWFTRCGHGVGFWEDDRGWGEYSEELTDAAHAAGPRYVYDTGRMLATA